MFIYIWEYTVKKDLIDEFENAYNPDGEWVRLFKHADGYLGTEFHRDVAIPNRYITIDYWMSQAMCETFRQQYADEFKAVDALCATLTEREALLGEFSCLGSIKVL